MAARSPLVIAGGQIEQLQAGDTLAGVSGVSATPTVISAGTTFTIAASTQLLWNDGIAVNGALAVNGSLRGNRM